MQRRSFITSLFLSLFTAKDAIAKQGVNSVSQDANLATHGGTKDLAQDLKFVEVTPNMQLQLPVGVSHGHTIQFKTVNINESAPAIIKSQSGFYIVDNQSTFMVDTNATFTLIYDESLKTWHFQA